MARGVRSNITMMPVFSQGQQPQSLSSYDARTRRNTILIAEIVPTLNESTGTSDTLGYLPSDRLYVALGAQSSTSYFPQWFGSGLGSETLQNYDSTRKRHYLDTATGVTFPANGSTVYPVMWPTGFLGESSSFAPKNATTVAVWFKFTAAFVTNADYGAYGVGACGLGSNFSSGAFSNTATDFIQVLRNGSAWELGSGDGAALSQSSGGTADGNPHEFEVRWSASDIKLYVDQVLTVTKSTNMPDQPLGPVFDFDGTNDAQMYDFLIEWEAG